MKIIGIISGTSVDGIDVAIAEIEGQPWLKEGADLAVDQIAFETVAWPEELRAQIFTLFEQAVPVAAVSRLNFLLGEQFAKAALQVINNAGLTPQEIDLIGSHGQTVWHDVENGQAISTLQLGEPSIIATRIGIPTVANFRTADIAVGGQGAPLTSTFDWHLLRPESELGGWRAVQNIGGIANVTFLPPRHLDLKPVALDSGPGNALIDWAASRATEGKWQYDVDGQLAAQGQIHEALLEAWLQHSYFTQPLPKTTGRELFGGDLAQKWYTEGLDRGLTGVDIVTTLTELTACTIAQAYVHYAPDTIVQAVVGGGGTHNPVLMARLEARLCQYLDQPVEFCTHRALGIDDDAKEALAFALLAYLTFHKQPGNVPACTGASKPQVLGQVAHVVGS